MLKPSRPVLTSALVFETDENQTAAVMGQMLARQDSVAVPRTAPLYIPSWHRIPVSRRMS